MPRSRSGYAGVAARLVCWTVFIAPAAASEAGAPAAVDALRVTPPRAGLRGPDAVQQLAVDGLSAGTEAGDLTDLAAYETSDAKVATVDASGIVTARGDGSATIWVTRGPLKVEVPVTVRDFAQGPPINFANQVVPIFTKLGCNAGGCHGKASGQNGFRLSLLGFEPDLDYETLVVEGRGRRLFPASPGQSLLLRKATAKVPPRRRPEDGARLARVSRRRPLDRRRDAQGVARRPDRRPHRDRPSGADHAQGLASATRRDGPLHRRIDRGRDPLGPVSDQRGRGRRGRRRREGRDP